MSGVSIPRKRPRCRAAGAVVSRVSPEKRAAVDGSGGAGHEQHPHHGVVRRLLCGSLRWEAGEQEHGMIYRLLIRTLVKKKDTC